MKLLKFEIRRLFFSPWSFIFYFPFLGICVALMIMEKGSISRFLGKGYYFDIFVAVCVPILALYTAQNINEFEFSVRKKQKVYLTKLTAIYLFLLPSLAFVILYIFLPVHSPVSFKLKLDYALFVMFTWNVRYLFFVTLGFFLGKVSKSKILYIFSFLVSFITSVAFESYIYYLFISNFYIKTQNTFFNLLNISRDEPFKVHHFGFGYISNRLLFYDTIFYFLISVILIGLIFITKRIFKKTNIPCVCVPLLMIPLIVVTVENSVINYPDFIYSDYSDSNNWDESKMDNTIINEKYNFLEVTAYKMDVDLQKSFKNNCKITISNKNQNEMTDTLEFKLDSCFVVDSVRIDGVKAEFNRKNDYIVITNIKDLKSSSSFEVEVNYAGNINYVSPVNIKTAFVDSGAAYLPEVFAWYPKLEAEKTQIRYQLSVKAGNKLVSNLSGNEVADGNGEYTFDVALGSDIYLLSGYFKTKIFEGVTITAFEDFIDTAYNKVIGIVEQYQSGEYPIYTRVYTNYANLEGLPVDTDDLKNVKILCLPFSWASAIDDYYFDNCIFFSETILTY